MQLETERLILRNFKESDLKDVFEYTSQAGVFDKTGWKHYEKIEEAKTLLERLTKSDNWFAITLKDSGKVIGHIDAKKDSENGREDTTELGFCLNKFYHRKGYMTEAVKRMLEYEFSLNKNFVYACCFKDNAASKGLIEKCGFKLEKEGTYVSKTLGITKSTYEYVFTRDMWEKI